MAAKGYDYFQSKSGVSRRYLPPSTRPRLMRSLRTYDSPGAPTSDTGCTTRKVQFDLTPSPDESIMCPTPALSKTYGDATEDADSSGPETPLPHCDYRSVSLDLVDFSAHANQALDGRRSNASSLTVFDVGSHARAAPEADLYGWEAELRRKAESGCLSPRDSSAVRSYFALDPSRQTPLKRNLLQRVFSLGDVRPRSGR